MRLRARARKIGREGVRKPFSYKKVPFRLVSYVNLMAINYRRRRLCARTLKLNNFSKKNKTKKQQ